MTAKERIAEINPEAIVFEGFDEAILGICDRFGAEPVLAYDRDLCIGVLIDQGMTDDDAEEYFAFNVIGTCAGEHTPVFISL